ncbi:MAG: ABC transporter ATP-binding protein [Proteobacteria bacterium]|nr:ABC transporter ATP-binding protein [Pseudomonadota bacterium]
MLRLRDLHTCYGRIEVLKGIDFEIAAGEIITLLGPNGAGKTTTLMSISGLVPPRRGEIVFKGRPIQGERPDRIVAMGISQVPEGRRIFPHLTVTENLDMGAFLRRGPEGIKAELDYIFQLFPILSERRHQAGGTLSGGEQQMLAISRALMARPELLLLDEPSLGLAPMIVQRIFTIIGQINRDHGTTMLLVEQNANLALRAAHRGCILVGGRLVLSGDAAGLLDNDAVRSAYLGL